MHSSYVHLWVHLLYKANWRSREFMSKGEIIQLKPGQFITGRDQLSAETGIHRSSIERILKVFEKEQQIEQQKTNKGRLITILSWDKYQAGEQQIEQQMSNQRASSEHPVSTPEEVKEVKDYKDNTDNTGSLPAAPPPAEKKVFSKPSLQDLTAYFSEIGLNGQAGQEAEKFIDFYTSKGWMVGKVRMKDWKASARNWKKGVKGIHLSPTLPTRQPQPAVAPDPEQEARNQEAIRKRGEELREMNKQRGLVNGGERVPLREIAEKLKYQ